MRAHRYFFGSMNLTKVQTVLITGASSGIGLAIATEYARHGTNLILLARREQRLQEIKHQLKDHAGSVLIHPCDVRNESEVQIAVEKGLEFFGQIDAVYANAGYGVTGGFDKLTNIDFENQFATNIYGVLNTVRATRAALEKSKGKLALMGSVSAYQGMIADAPYSMSKAAIRSLADTLYLELKPAGVSVTLITPGFVKSEIRQVDNAGVHHPNAKDNAPAWAVMETDVAARKIVEAVENRQREVVVTVFGKIFVWLRRFLPALAFKVIELMGRKRHSRHIKHSPSQSI